MITDWYQRSIDALPRHGNGERTQEAYTRAGRRLSPFSSKPPRPDPVPPRSRPGTVSVGPASRRMDIVTLTHAPSHSAPRMNSLFDPGPGDA